MESGFVNIYFPSNTNTILLILSPLTQCSFLLCFSCDVYLARVFLQVLLFFCSGGFGDFLGCFVGLCVFVGFLREQADTIKKDSLRVKVSHVV